VLLPPRKRRSSNSFLSSQWRDMMLNSKKRQINARRTPDERQKGAVELRGKNSPRSDRCCFHSTTIFCSYIGARTMTGSAFLHTLSPESDGWHSLKTQRLSPTVHLPPQPIRSEACMACSSVRGSSLPYVAEV